MLLQTRTFTFIYEGFRRVGDEKKVIRKYLRGKKCKKIKLNKKIEMIKYIK